MAPNLFFRNTNKIKKKTQSTKIMNKQKEITTDFIDTKVL